jgi:hypothetical protein
MKHVLILCFFSLSLFSQAQVDLKWTERKAQIRLGGGSLQPSADFALSGEQSLFVLNGFQVNAGFIYGIYRNLGLGVHLDYNQYGFDLNRFSAQQGGAGVTQLSSFNSTRFGLSVPVFLPIRLGKKSALLITGEGQAGIRNMNIPKLDLAYDELDNNFTVVSYRPRANSMGYLAITGGLQCWISKGFGLYVQYQKTLDSRHSIKYSSRAFDTSKELTEGEHRLHQYVGSSGIQGGLIFIMGRK